MNLFFHTYNQAKKIISVSWRSEILVKKLPIIFNIYFIFRKIEGICSGRDAEQRCSTNSV